MRLNYGLNQINCYKFLVTSNAYFQHASAQTSIPASLVWHEKQCLFAVFISVTILGSVVSVMIMELIAAIRMPNERTQRKPPTNVDRQ